MHPAHLLLGVLQEADLFRFRQGCVVHGARPINVQVHGLQRGIRPKHSLHLIQPRQRRYSERERRQSTCAWSKKSQRGNMCAGEGAADVDGTCNDNNQPTANNQQPTSNYLQLAIETPTAAHLDTRAQQEQHTRLHAPTTNVSRTASFVAVTGTPNRTSIRPGTSVVTCSAVMALSGRLAGRGTATLLGPRCQLHLKQSERRQVFNVVHWGVWGAQRVMEEGVGPAMGAGGGEGTANASYTADNSTASPIPRRAHSTTLESCFVSGKQASLTVHSAHMRKRLRAWTGTRTGQASHTLSHSQSLRAGGRGT